MITAASYALLLCTSHQDVLAHSSENRVIESHNNLLETLELEQTKRNMQSSFKNNQEEEVQHSNNMMQLNIPTRLLRDTHQYSSDNTKRRVQRRGDDTIAQAAPGSNNNNNNGYDAYGVPPTSNTAASETNNNNNDNNNDTNNGSTGWFGKKQSPDNTAAANTNDGNSAYGSYSGNSNSASSGAYGSYGSAAGSTGSNSDYGSYGASPSSSAYGASPSSSAYGASSTSAYGASPSSSAYGASSTSAYGASPRSSSSYGGSSYSSTWGTGSASSSSKWGSNTSNNLRGGNGPVKIGLFKAIFFLLLICTTGMLLTAHSLEHHPEGTFANCCRVSLHTVNCVYRVMFNLYHCRLGELPGIICGGSELEEDEYTEEELERMTLRPGIERALDTEHRKALRKVGVEMNMIKPKNGSGKSKGVQNGASISR